ncbi:hypothetical protein QO179_24105 [Bacillus stercoris]|nr:hypothetical protein [Bacillus stercoris]
MIIKKHAVNRFKKRIGHRTASRKRICHIINKEIEKNLIRKVYYNDSDKYKIETPKFTAVCHKRYVITILNPNFKYRK